MIEVYFFDNKTFVARQVEIESNIINGKALLTE